MIYEILRVDHEPGMDVAFARAWDENGKPLGFGADGSCEIERIRIFNPPQIAVVGGVRIADPDLALRMDVERTLRLVGKDGTKIVPGKTANTTTVVRPAAGAASPVDGRVAQAAVDNTFADIRAAAGNSADSTDTGSALQMTGSATSNQFSLLRRCVFGFDASAITDTDTISAATLQLYGIGKSVALGDTGVCITTATPASSSSLANSDYAVANFGSTELATRIAINASWNTAGFNDFALNASGLAHISKTTYTFFGARLGWDVDDSFGGAWGSGLLTRANMSHADEASTTQDPVLTITHAAAGGATSGAGVNRGLVNAGSLVNGSLIRTAFEKVGDLFVPDCRIYRPRLVPVGIAL